MNELYSGSERFPQCLLIGTNRKSKLYHVHYNLIDGIEFFSVRLHVPFLGSGEQGWLCIESVTENCWSSVHEQMVGPIE